MKVGRKATIGGAVILIMSYLIQTGILIDIDRQIAMGIIAITCWLYMYINFRQKTILPVGMEISGDLSGTLSGTVERIASPEVHEELLETGEKREKGGDSNG